MALKTTKWDPTKYLAFPAARNLVSARNLGNYELH
jgi:hypothetical protein